MRDLSERAEIIIEAIEKNSNSFVESINIPNRGNIANLPDGVVVEVPGIVSGNGVTGLAVGELPAAMEEWCRRQLLINELTVQAVIEGNIRLVYRLLALDPMITSTDTAIKLADFAHLPQVSCAPAWGSMGGVFP